MKFLHVILPTKRMMETYIQMIRENYPREDHIFYFLGKCPKSEESLFEYGNVVELADGESKFDKIRNFYRDISDCDYIVWHCLTLSPKFVLFFSVFPYFLKKMIWVMWGIDLYEFNRPICSLKDRLLNHLNWRLRRAIRYVAAIFPTDIPAYKKIFQKKENTLVFYAPYPMRKKVFFDLENLNPNVRRANGEIWIQIGNNANSFNRHLDILETIKKFADQKVRIFIPMSYGNDWHNKIPNYVDIVQAKAIEYFGEERVTVLKKLMPLDEYSKFLDQMDIIIIATDRQNALGNIEKNMFSGGKVYLSEKNPLYAYFNEQGIQVGKYEDIDNENFDEFSKFQDNRKIRRWMINAGYPENNIIYWNNLFKAFGYPNALSEDKLGSEEERMNQAVAEIKAHSTEKIKMNYINLEKYIYANRSAADRRMNAQNVVFVGEDDSVKCLIEKMHNENIQVHYQWNILGMIDWEMIDVREMIAGYNTISTLREVKRKGLDNEKLAIFCDDPVKRENYFTYLEPKEEDLCSIRLYGSYIAPDIRWKREECICIGRGSQMNNHCEVGRLLKVGDQSYVGCNCKIGDYVTIGDHVFIGENTVIGDGAVIRNGVHLISGSVINANYVAEEGKDVNVICRE